MTKKKSLSGKEITAQNIEMAEQRFFAEHGRIGNSVEIAKVSGYCRKTVAELRKVRKKKVMIDITEYEPLIKKAFNKCLNEVLNSGNVKDLKTLAEIIVLLSPTDEMKGVIPYVGPTINYLPAQNKYEDITYEEAKELSIGYYNKEGITYND